MNDKKREKVVHCWGKTGLLAIWDVNERAALVPKAFAETSRLFPSRDMDNRGAMNEHDVIASSRVRRGRGRGSSIPPVTAASQALAFNRTRTREVCPAARMDA